jgi:hypothetical protein
MHHTTANINADGAQCELGELVIRFYDCVEATAKVSNAAQTSYPNNLLGHRAREGKLESAWSCAGLENIQRNTRGERGGGNRGRNW